jgi:hypothetical protein
VTAPALFVPETPHGPSRVIALGASNLTRGFGTVLGAARALLGEPLEVFAALGHGRSYGMRSTFCGRSLPGILGSGLFSAVEDAPAVKTRALIMDIGNDILYGAPVPQILSWVDRSAERLLNLTDEVVVTDLPIASIEGLSRVHFMLLRSVIVPSCRLSLEVVQERSRELNAGIVALAHSRGLRLVHLREEWYRGDPIHIRPRFWGAAFQEIFLGARLEPAPRIGGGVRALELYLAPPERRWLLGIEQRHAQPAIRTRTGTTVSFY